MRGTLRTIGGLLSAAVLGALLSSQQQLVIVAAIAAGAFLAGSVVLSVPAIRNRWSWAQTDDDRSSALETDLAALLIRGNDVAGRVATHPARPTRHSTN